MKIIKFAACLTLPMLLLGCQSMTGKRSGDLYFSPAGAYVLDLGINTFRGEVVLDERCDANGGSTTLWDGSGRQFRIDYLRVDDHPMIQAPRFASDLTLMNLTLNSYLREVVAPAPLVTRAEASHRELLEDSDPRALFAIIGIQVDPEQIRGAIAEPGSHYYGFMVFRRGDLLYVLQHRQPNLMPDKMQAVLVNLADAMEVPGRARQASDMNRMRRTLSRMNPLGSEGSVRLCEPEQG